MVGERDGSIRSGIARLTADPEVAARALPPQRAGPARLGGVYNPPRPKVGGQATPAPAHLMAAAAAAEPGARTLGTLAGVAESSRGGVFVARHQSARWPTL